MTSTNDEREALRECPFCGTPPKRIEPMGEWTPNGYAPDGVRYVCGALYEEPVRRCPGAFASYGPNAESEAIAAWNTRSLPAPAPAHFEGASFEAVQVVSRLIAGNPAPSIGQIKQAERIVSNLLQLGWRNEPIAPAPAPAPATVGQQVADLIEYFSEPTPPTTPAVESGEGWVCDGIPDAAIEAGIAAWDTAKHDMENYVSGVTTDWDEGMIVAAIYKAMRPAVESESGERRENRALAAPQPPATGGYAGKILCWDHEIREPDCPKCQSETAALRSTRGEW